MNVFHQTLSKDGYDQYSYISLNREQLNLEKKKDLDLEKNVQLINEAGKICTLKKGHRRSLVIMVETNFALFQVYKKYRKGRYHKCHHSIFFNKWSSLSLSFFLDFVFTENSFVLFWIFFSRKKMDIQFFLHDDGTIGTYIK